MAALLWITVAVTVCMLFLAASEAAIRTQVQSVVDRIGDERQVQREIAAVRMILLTGARGQGDAVAERLFAEDAVVRFASGVLRGRSEIQSGWSKLLSEVSGLDGTPEELVVAGDAVYEIGRYSCEVAKAGRDCHLQKGTYGQVWKRQNDGSWKVRALLVN